MPRVGPGEDNVTGDRYTLDLGVEPDLGNLLQNLQVANDYLDQAEQRFRTINDVVGNTTQRLAAATRQTQLLAQETQRLQNSYQAIAASSMGMANMGGGMPMGGQMAFGGMPSYGGSMQQGATGNIVQTMPTSVVGDENASFMPPSSVSQPTRMPSMRMIQLEQGKEFLFGQGGRGGGLVDRVLPGGKGGIGRAIESFRNAYSPGRVAAGAAGAPGGIMGLNAAGGAAEGGGLASAAARLGGLARVATPYLAAGAAGLYAAQKGYEIWAGAQADSRALAGLTGGEAGLAGMMGNNRVPGSFALNARARLMGFLNPGVDYGEIQERALGAGYVEGKGYEQARDYLFETYTRGLGNTVDQMDLYKEAVDKAGGSTGQLVSAMDSLRETASNTNVSISVLYTNMKAQVEDLTSMGLSGGSAIAQATRGATAYAEAPMGSLNPNIREAGGFSITASPFMQTRAAGQFGVPVGGLAPFLYSNPGADVNVAGERAAIDVLNRFGFSEGMTADQINEQVRARGWGGFTPDGQTIIGSMLSQLGVLPQGLTSADYRTIINWIWTTLNERPQASQVLAARRERQGELVSDYRTMGPSRAGEQSLSSYGTGAGVSGYVRSLGLDPDNPLGGMLTRQFGQEGARTSPILDKILAGENSPENTYVKTGNGRVIRLDVFMKQNPNWQSALSEGRVQIAHADDATQKQLHGQTSNIEDTDVVGSGNLSFNTTTDELQAGKGAGGAKTRVRAASQIMALDDNTIERLAHAVGNQVADSI